jgi:hypothetical protein
MEIVTKVLFYDAYRFIGVFTNHRHHVTQIYHTLEFLSFESFSIISFYIVSLFYCFSVVFYVENEGE